MSIVRIAKQENNTGAALSKSELSDGRDYKYMVIERVFSAADLSATVSAAGCLVGTITSGKIHKIVGATYQEKTPVDQFAKYQDLSGGSLSLTDSQKSVRVKDATTAILKAGGTLFVEVLIAPNR